MGIMKQGVNLSTFLRNNWIELLLVLVFVAAGAWLFVIGRELLAPTVEEEVALSPTPAVLDAGAAETAPAALGLEFNGQRALADVAHQVALGPRPSGSSAAANASRAIADELEQLGWAVETQTFERDGVPLRNVVAKAGVGDEIVLIAAHYDTRPVADRDADPANRRIPGLGANGSASGVAVLMELARSLDRGLLDKQVWLVFFDGGDHADVDGWPASVGADAYLGDLTTQPSAMILVDVVGAENQRFRYDRNSDTALSARLWQIAAQLGYGDWFLAEAGEAIVDDHLPFKQAGIPVAALVGIDYPYRYTLDDTPAKVSADSLERVGRVLEQFLETDAP